MKREVSLEEISDGKLYGPNDMVKADCQDCLGCSACCRGMGSSVVLDPLDIHRMTGGLHQTMEQLLAGPIELNVAEGLILPNLKMTGEQEACSYLNEAGRCIIHAFRPGICRLFPLGRIYENGTFRYFLQKQECRKENRTKVKVRKWLDTPDFNRYETYIADWHYFLLDLQEMLAGGQCNTKNNAESSTGSGLETESGSKSETRSGSSMAPGLDMSAAKQVSMYLLKAFYLVPFDQKEDFYCQFDQRLKAAKRRLLKG